ncbi:Protein transport protein sft2 [Diplonema papillatum]|nr:Protein transport protein sft2 [Diplonema papillatum]
MPMDVIVKIKEQMGVGGSPQEPQTMWDELGESVSLTWSQRIILFAMCMGMSGVCFALAGFFTPMIVIAPNKFVFFFTCANIFGLGSTTFLVGPSRQFRNMAEHHRMLIAAVYMGSTVFTLVAVMHRLSSVLIMICCGIQITSLVWYSLSYIPYARHVASYVLGPILQACMVSTRVICTGCGKCCMVACGPK